MNKKSINTVIEENSDFIMSINGVVGLGQGLCGEEDCIKIFVIRKTKNLVKHLPHFIEGYRTELIETGDIKAR